MRKRLFLRTLGIAVFLAISSLSVQGAAYALSPALSGAMQKFRSLPGQWECSSHISGKGVPEQTLTMLMTFDVVDGNVLHDHLSAHGFDAHLYYGYSSKRQDYWAITANSDGTQLQQRSTDAIHFGGAIVQNPRVKIADDFKFVDASHFRIHDITTLPAGTTFVTNSACTRKAARSLLH